MLVRCLGIILLVSIVAAEPAFAEAPLPFVARVKSDRVYVRAGQNANFETVAVVKKGETLVVLAKSFGWCRVKVPPQSKAYLKAGYSALLTPSIGEITFTRPSSMPTSIPRPTNLPVVPSRNSL